MAIDGAALDGYLGKHIKDICLVGYADNGDNHCAHFVSHALGLQHGTTCKMLKGGAAKDAVGASIRVHEIFAKCSKVGQWNSEPRSIQHCLIFITKASDVKLETKEMTNIPKKHVGIAIGDDVWHYSNSQDKVVKVSVAQFRRHYYGDGFDIYYGDL
jgi:hypothetical protein